MAGGLTATHSLELRAENALCRPEIDIIVINQPNRLVMHTPTLWHDRGLA